MDREAWWAIVHGIARVGDNSVTKPPPNKSHPFHPQICIFSCLSYLEVTLVLLQNASIPTLRFQTLSVTEPVNIVVGQLLCPTLCDPTDCSLPGSSVHGISQARILEWVVIPSPGDLPNPGMEPASPALAGRFFITEPPGKPWDLSILCPKSFHLSSSHFSSKQHLVPSSGCHHLSPRSLHCLLTTSHLWYRPLAIPLSHWPSAIFRIDICCVLTDACQLCKVPVLMDFVCYCDRFHLMILQIKNPSLENKVSSFRGTQSS